MKNISVGAGFPRPCKDEMSRVKIRKSAVTAPLQTVLVFICAAFFWQRNLYACPLCNEAVAKMGQIWTSLGFNWSIYLMIAVPFILVGSFAAALVVISEKNAKRLG